MLDKKDIDKVYECYRKDDSDHPEYFGLIFGVILVLSIIILMFKNNNFTSSMSWGFIIVGVAIFTVSLHSTISSFKETERDISEFTREYVSYSYEADKHIFLKSYQLACWSAELRNEPENFAKIFKEYFDKRFFNL